MLTPSRRLHVDPPPRGRGGMVPSGSGSGPPPPPPSSTRARSALPPPVKGLLPLNNENSNPLEELVGVPVETEERNKDLSRELTSTTTISSLPDNVLENVFTFLELGDVVSVGAVSSAWARVMSDENGDVWRALCLRRMDRDVLGSDLLVACPTFKTKLRAQLHAWNPHDCSRNIVVRPHGFTIHRNPVAQSTDGARGKVGFRRGRHAWEVRWEGPLGTVAVVGVATREAELRSQGYIALLGRDERSWGWNLVENVLIHNGESQGNYPLVNNAPRYQVGERIRVILDCEDNTLSFEKNEEFLGVAFRGLPSSEPLFPAVSAVYGNSEISMVYLGPPLDG